MIHSKLLDISLQQSSAGQMPSGLLAEINDARNLATDIVKTIDPRKFEKELPLEIIKDFSARKLYSRWLPKLVGGGGGHPLAFYGLNLEMGGHCLGISNLIGAHYVALGLVSATGSFGVLSKITEEILLAESNGSHCSAALAITEPGAGSDMEDAELLTKAKVCTKAIKVSGGYKISGQKIFISNALFAKWYIGSAFLDLANPAESLVIFAVKADALGVSLGRTEKKLGQNASPASVVFFENVFVADDDICFSPDQFLNFKDFLVNSEFLLNDLLSLSRAGVGALATGVQKRVLEIVIEVGSKNRDGHEWMQAEIGKLVENFLVSKTVSWEGHVECYSRGPYKDLQHPLIYRFFKYMPTALLKYTLGAILKSKSGRDALRKKRRESISISDEKMIFGWGSLAKSVCTDKAIESTHLALALVGSDGGAAFWELEKFLRDVKLQQIYEGTNELNRLMIYKNFIGDEHKANLIFQEAKR